MNILKVSVCVVTYNHARYIRDCLMSVLAQSEDVSLEILVGDDLSEDETGDIVQSLVNNHSKLIRYFRHIKRKGPLGNYQFLIREARGEYIAHLDGDDFWLPDKLRRQIDFLDAMPQLVAAYSNAIVVDEGGNLRGGFNKQIPSSFGMGFLLRKGNFLCHSSLIYRAKFSSYILAISPPFIDYQVHLILAQQGKLGYINSALVGYRVASTTSMTVLKVDHVRDLYWQALMSVEKSPQLNQDIGSSMAQFLFISLWNLISMKKFSSISSLWKTVTAVIPISIYKFLYLFSYFFFEHLWFKSKNFLCIKILRRPLKVYFER